MRSLLLSTALILPLPLWAQDAALILGTERYEQLDRVSRADDVLDASDKLEALGFIVSSRANPRIDAAKDLAAAFQMNVAASDRLVVVLTGHFVTDGTRTWLLTAEATTPDLFSVDDAAVSLDSLLTLLAQTPGKAVLLLGAAEPDDLDLADSALRAGIGDLALPQGVTLIRTTPSMAANVLSGQLTEPEAEIGQLLMLNPSLFISGYFPRDWLLMPGEVIVEPTIPIQGPSEADLTAEATLWDQTTAADTAAGYRAYVERYPQGRFVDDAEAQIAAILAEPNRPARLAEDALALTRQNRRDIQSQLTLLNYNTRGVDGIFGPGSRGAITNWQQMNGFPQTSYLTRDQINLIDAQAARRQAEIDAEATRAQAQAEALDRSYWAETGGLGDEPGFRAYLARYPSGLFADIAKARLATIEESRRALVEADDRVAWATAQNADIVAGYQDYLAAYPSGVFAAQARARMAELNRPQNPVPESSLAQVPEAQIAQSRAQEARLRLSGVRAQLLELRLRELGHDPGRLDGVLDDTTRAAISAYQSANGLPATGYVDQATAVGLLRGGR